MINPVQSNHKLSLAWIPAAALIAILIYVIWDPSAVDPTDVDGRANIEAMGESVEEHATVGSPSPSNEEGAATERRSSQWRIPIYLQTLKDSIWVEAEGVDVRYFSESIRLQNGGALAEFDAHNPWRDARYDDLPSVRSDAQGLAFLDTEEGEIWLYARQGEAIMIHRISADQDWPKLAENGLLCHLQPCEVIQVSVRHDDGSPAASVPVRILSFQSARGITGADGIADLLLPKALTEERLDQTGADSMPALTVIASLRLIGSPSGHLRGFDQGKRSCKIRLPRCSKVVVRSKPVGFTGNLSLMVTQGNFSRGVKLRKTESDQFSEWTYDFAPLGKPCAIQLGQSGPVYQWRLPLEICKGRTSATAGATKVFDLEWDSVFLAGGKLKSPPHSKNTDTLRLLALTEQGKACLEPVILKVEADGSFEVAFIAPEGDVRRIRHLWLQNLTGKGQNKRYSQAEYFVEDLKITPGQRLDLGTLQPAPVEPLVSGAAQYDDGEMFYGYGLRANKIIANAQPGGRPILLPVNMANEGVDNSVGFSGLFAATHSVSPFPCSYELRAAVKDCLTYHADFKPGAKNVPVVLQLLCTVNATFKSSVFDSTLLQFTLTDESGWETVGRFAGGFDFQAEVDEFRRLTFYELAPGGYSFQVATAEGEVLAQIPYLKIEDKEARPPELQNMVIEQPGMVSLKVVLEDGNAIDFRELPKPEIQIFELTDDGFIPSKQYSTKQEHLRIHKSALQAGNLLSVPGYLPVDLKGFGDGDEIQLQKSPVIHFRIQPPRQHPDNFPYLLSITAAKQKHGQTPPIGVGKLTATSKWTYEFNCPGKGDYQLEWSLYVDPSGAPGHRLFVHQGQTIHLDPAKNDGDIILEMPPKFVAEAIRWADWLSEIGQR
jgi:hypothetical protein